ncbi:MAG: hypothetical protein ACLP0J_16170 [Solirubrobacteraceae bacterium]|jgi:hypothetical protein
MSDDWRLRIELADGKQAGELARMLGSGELEHQLDEGYIERVIVSRDGVEVFAYGGSRTQVQRAADAIHELATQRGWQIDAQLARWHPVAEEWEDPDAPLPEGDAGLEAERAALIKSEREESAAAGYPQWEVRVECDSHHDTLRLAAKLNEEGIPSVRRWRYLLVGATDEASADALAARLRLECPPDFKINVEESGAAVEATRPFNPFAVLGGLGG